MPRTVSIVTPSYNQGQFLEETIKSVLSQKGDFIIDYIIKDGGSTDGSVDIIKRYQTLLQNSCDAVQTQEGTLFVQRDSCDFNQCRGIRYRWVSEPDGGQVDAIRKGFAEANGDVAVWLNSDDVFHDDGVIARVFSAFRKNPGTDIVTGDGLIIDKQGKPLGEHHVDRLSLPELLYLDYHILQPATFLSRKVYRSELLDESYNFCFDAEYFIRLLIKGFTFTKVDDKFASFRLYPETKTLSGLNRRYRESLRIAATYGSNRRYYHISRLYKYFEIVLQNKYPDSGGIRTATSRLQKICYKIITGRTER